MDLLVTASNYSSHKKRCGVAWLEKKDEPEGRNKKKLSRENDSDTLRYEAKKSSEEFSKNELLEEETESSEPEGRNKKKWSKESDSDTLRYEAEKSSEEFSKNELLEEETESSESEDDDGELLTNRVGCKILDTLQKIKSKDPAVYDENVHFFNDSDFEEDNIDEKKGDPDSAAKENPVFYKDVLRKSLLSGGAEVFVEEDDELERREQNPSSTYLEEQSSLKKAFLMAANETMDGEESLFVTKQKTQQEIEDEDNKFQQFLKEKSYSNNERDIMMSHYWAEDEELNEKERYLRDYILNEAWRDGKNTLQINTDLDKCDVEDEEHLKKTDEFEASYNFRFEDEVGRQLQSHARHVEGSVRRKDNRRKLARIRKAERVKAEKIRRQEELKRLKNLKKQEIIERIGTIQKITGAKDICADVMDVNAYFGAETDPGQMQAVLGEDYDAQEPLATSELCKLQVAISHTTEFAKMISVEVPEEMRDILGTSNIEGKKMSARQRKLAQRQNRSKVKYGVDDGEPYASIPIEEENTAREQNNSRIIEDDDNSSCNESGLWWMCDVCGKGIEGGDERYDCTICSNYTLCKHCFPDVGHEHEMRLEKTPNDCMPPENLKPLHRDAKKMLDQYMEEYFQLDYEDIIGGDLPTRFKYKKVEPESYGMTTSDILKKSDQELNKLIPIDNLAAYRTEQDESIRAGGRKTLKQQKNKDRSNRNPSHYNDIPESRLNAYRMLQRKGVAFKFARMKKRRAS